MKRWNGPDYDLWLAIHDDCPVHADCCELLPSLELNDQALREIRVAAWLLGLSIPAFISHALRVRLAQPVSVIPEEVAHEGSDHVLLSALS